MRICFTALLLVAAAMPALAADAARQASVDRGRYLLGIAGCNDCHTPGYIEKASNVPESEWLKGDTMGWSGPWGTTYAPNLRLSLANMDMAQWKTFARTAELRPPMPYWLLRAMTDEDLEALWNFTRSLGKGGEKAPAALPPGVEAPLPYFKLHVPAEPVASK